MLIFAYWLKNCLSTLPITTNVLSAMARERNVSPGSRITYDRTWLAARVRLVTTYTRLCGTK